MSAPWNRWREADSSWAIAPWASGADALVTLWAGGVGEGSIDPAFEPVAGVPAGGIQTLRTETPRRGWGKPGLGEGV
ncbi:MAG: hypothetical protein U5J83_13445 [Bryobacterales bacterium]|nr:hypothetical protein [Bryobacterales bacterium]